MSSLKQIGWQGATTSGCREGDKCPQYRGSVTSEKTNGKSAIFFIFAPSKMQFTSLLSPLPPPPPKWMPKLATTPHIHTLTSIQSVGIQVQSLSALPTKPSVNSQTGVLLTSQIVLGVTLSKGICSQYSRYARVKSSLLNEKYVSLKKSEFHSNKSKISLL